MRIGLYCLLFLSSVWIAILTVGFFSGSECNRTNEPVVLACLTSNEIGDFLAGAFAPLAFIWLAFAVFIQARELKAQREELSLTRAEMKLSREVAEDAKEATRAQAEEARRSGDYFKKQTEILEYENLLRQQSEARRDYVSLCESEQNPTISHPSVTMKTFPPKVIVNGQEFNISSPSVFDVNIGTKIETFRTIFSQLKESIDFHINDSNDPDDIRKSIYDLDEIGSYHAEIYKNYITRLSEADARSLRIEERNVQIKLLGEIQNIIEDRS